jgi:hypothetical protein
MPDAATPTKTIRRLNVEPLPPALEGLAPPAVVERSREAAEVQARAAETAAAARAATEGIAGARAADEAAAVDAAEQGNAPPKPTLGKAEERAQEAGRAAAAHVELERRAKLAYLDAVRDALPAMKEAAEAELGKVSGAATEHLDALQAALLRSREVRILLRALDPESLVGREPTFTPAVRLRRGRPRSPITAEAQGHLDGLRAELDSDE